MAAMSPQGLLEALSAVADPRKSRGVRHRFISILALGACAVLSGARSCIAIAEWAMDLTPLLRAKLGIGRVPPCESTIRRVLQRVDPDVLWTDGEWIWNDSLTYFVKKYRIASADDFMRYLRRRDFEPRRPTEAEIKAAWEAAAAGRNRAAPLED